MKVRYGVMNPHILHRLMSIKQPYNINTAAEIALIASLEDLSFLKQNIERIITERTRLFDELSLIENVTPYPSDGNFILCSFTGIGAKRVYEELASKGIFVRYFDTPSLKDSIRISVGKPEHTDILVGALKEIMTG